MRVRVCVCCTFYTNICGDSCMHRLLLCVVKDVCRELTLRLSGTYPMSARNLPHVCQEPTRCLPGTYPMSARNLPHVCQELVQSFLSLHGPHLELAEGVVGVTETLKQRPVAVHSQLQLRLKCDLQTVHRDDVLTVVFRPTPVTRHESCSIYTTLG